MAFGRSGGKDVAPFLQLLGRKQKASGRILRAEDVPP